MTKQLSDLFDSWTEKTTDEQLQKIREVRHSRNIERPAVAKRRHKKAKKASVKKVDKLKAMVGKMSDEEKQAMIDKLRSMKDV